jgi:energy-coupling factor transport system substrate-specific component
LAKKYFDYLTINTRILRERPFTAWSSVLLLGLAGGLLISLNELYTHLPLFLDTIGTLVATAAFGLVPGILTAVVTHLSYELMVGLVAPERLIWTLVNISSAIVLTILLRKGRFENPIDAVIALILITLVNALLGALLAAFLFSGNTDHHVDYLVSTFIAAGQNLLSAAFWARLPINVIDKGIAVLIAFAAKRLWFDRWREIREESL